MKLRREQAQGREKRRRTLSEAGAAPSDVKASVPSAPSGTVEVEVEEFVAGEGLRWVRGRMAHECEASPTACCSKDPCEECSKVLEPEYFLPPLLAQKYREVGIKRLHAWQAKCLLSGGGSVMPTAEASGASAVAAASV